MSRIRWIHFSDLHLNLTGTETKRLRENLLEYLDTIVGKIDYAFFTGDIRHAPSGDFPSNAGKEIENICNAIGLPEKRLFIVPGNHDIDRNCSKKNKVINRMLSGENRYKSEDGIILEKDIVCLCKAKKSFYKFVDGVDSKWIYKEQLTDTRNPHFLIITDDFNVIHIDSTLFYSEQRQRDFVVGTYRIQELLEEADANKMTIIMSHYSFDFIEENERRELIALLMIIMLLCGLRGMNTTFWRGGSMIYFMNFKQEIYIWSMGHEHVSWLGRLILIRDKVW